MANPVKVTDESEQLYHEIMELLEGKQPSDAYDAVRNAMVRVLVLTTETKHDAQKQAAMCLLDMLRDIDLNWEDVVH